MSSVDLFFKIFIAEWTSPVSKYMLCATRFSENLSYSSLFWLFAQLPMNGAKAVYYVESLLNLGGVKVFFVDLKKKSQPTQNQK